MINYIKTDLINGFSKTKYRLIFLIIFTAIVSLNTYNALNVFGDIDYGWYGVLASGLFFGTGEYHPEEGFLYPPVMWIIMMICLPYIFADYAYYDTDGFGNYKILSAGRKKWWISKFIWTVSETAICELVILCISLLCVVLSHGAIVEPQVDKVLYLYEFGEMLSYKYIFYIYIFIIPFICFLTIALWSVVLGMILGPNKSFMFLSIYIVMGIYVLSPYTIGNQMMFARSEYLNFATHKVGLGQSIWIDIILIIIGFVVGLEHIERKNFIGGVEQE